MTFGMNDLIDRATEMYRSVHIFTRQAKEINE